MVRKRAQQAKNGSFPLLCKPFRLLALNLTAPTNDKRQAENKAHSNIFLVARCKVTLPFLMIEWPETAASAKRFISSSSVSLENNEKIKMKIVSVTFTLNARPLSEDKKKKQTNKQKNKQQSKSFWIFIPMGGSSRKNEKLLFSFCPGPIFLNEEIGTLSKDDEDGSENVGKKMNLYSLKLNPVYLDPLNMSNVGDFSWSWILKDFIQVQREEGKFVVVCSHPP